MKSIFAVQDIALNPQPRFWQLEQDRHSPLLQPLTPGIHEGGLRLRVDSTCFKHRFFVLTRDRLYFCKVTYKQSARDRRPLKHVFVSWKFFDAFNETDLEVERFGFRLGSDALHEDFYTESDVDLDQWILSLKEVCLLLDLSKDLHISAVIGSGTFATVSLAQDIDTGEFLAVKTVRKELLCESESNLEMHIKEISVLRTVRHMRIIRLRRVYEDEDCINLVLDYQPGGDLYSRIMKLHRYTESKAASLFGRLVEVVHYLHSIGYVHRDIKPENILLVSPDMDCEFKLADFGLATEIGPGSLHLKCGSPGYIAPEMLRWARYGPKADMFSCGAVLYFLLAGRPPFEGKTPSEVVRKNKECRVFFNAQHWNGVSRDAVELVLGLTHPDPLQRMDAEQALQHAWLRNKCPVTELRPSRVTSHLLGRQAEDRISHELMTRLTRKTPELTSPSLEKTNEKRKKSCLVNLRLEVGSSSNSRARSAEADDVSENREKCVVRVDPQTGPGTILLRLER